VTDTYERKVSEFDDSIKQANKEKRLLIAESKELRQQLQDAESEIEEMRRQVEEKNCKVKEQQVDLERCRQML